MTNPYGYERDLRPIRAVWLKAQPVIGYSWVRGDGLLCGYRLPKRRKSRLSSLMRIVCLTGEDVTRG